MELRDVDHTHPETDEPFGELVTYSRGPTPVHSDGRQADETDTQADVSRETEVQSVHQQTRK